MAPTIGHEVREAAARLQQAGVDTPLLDAELMMARALERPRLFVAAHPDHQPTTCQLTAFLDMLGKREQRYPLAYLTGSKEFFGLEIAVEPGVLVPRPETEILVEEVLRRVGNGLVRVVDVGAGSGAICLAIAHSLPKVEVYATEVSVRAAKVARANVEKHQLSGRVRVIEGDLLDPVRALAPFDAIVSNPPYIPSADIDHLQPEVSLYEPREALDGGQDGLDVYRRLLPEANALLKDGGFVAVEVGEGQSACAGDIARAAGYAEVHTTRDLAGIERVVVAAK